MTLRRETIVIALALLLIAAAIPFAISETIEKGRVYLFSRQFLEELPQRFTGPGRFRFILQPMIAIFLGIRGGLVDAKSGKPPYVFSLIFHAGRRRELLRSGVAARPLRFRCRVFAAAEGFSMLRSKRNRPIRPQTAAPLNPKRGTHQLTPG